MENEVEKEAKRRKLNEEDKVFEEIRRRCKDEPSKLQKLCLGLVFGIAVGDAKGIPYENLSYSQIREELEPDFEKDGKTKEYYRICGSHNPYIPVGFGPGKTTDDTSLSIAIINSLWRKRSFDPFEIGATHIEEWRKSVIGWGGTVHAVAKMAQGTHSIFTCGNISATGNGAIMKICPLAFFFAHQTNPKEELKLQQLQILSALSHDTPCSMVATNLFVNFAERIYRNPSVLDTPKSRRDLLDFIIQRAIDLENRLLNDWHIKKAVSLVLTRLNEWKLAKYRSDISSIDFSNPMWKDAFLKLFSETVTTPSNQLLLERINNILISQKIPDTYITEISDIIFQINKTIIPISPLLKQLLLHFDSLTNEQVINITCGGTFFCIHSLSMVIALIIRKKPSFDMIIEAALMGGDTDSNAAMVGGIIGGILGIEVFPSPYLQGLVDWPEFVDASIKLAEAVSHANDPIPNEIQSCSMETAIQLIKKFRQMHSRAFVIGFGGNTDSPISNELIQEFRKNSLKVHQIQLPDSSQNVEEIEVLDLLSQCRNVDFTNFDVVIIQGFLALFFKELRELMDMKCWLSTKGNLEASLAFSQYSANWNDLTRSTPTNNFSSLISSIVVLLTERTAKL